ncbi:hypothetical protein D3C71_2024150 [compost metagenome]
MPQAHAQHGYLALEALDQREADTRLIGRARTGRQHDGFRRHGGDFVERDLVIAAHGNIGAQFAQEMDEVVGKAVVIIDDESTGHLACP